jgi:hypothetical protein
MRCGVYHVTDNEIKQRLELALRSVEKLPTLEEALEQVSTHGVLRGPVDWVFPAWMLYVEYATQKIAETFQLSEEEKRQLFHFKDTLKRLLLEAWMQAKEKLTTLCKAVSEGTYRLEGKRLYAPDGVWVYVIEDFTPRVLNHDINASARFPDVLKLPRERLELLQLGWRASDEGNKKGRPFMGTTQPWQAFAWVAVRYGELFMHVASVNLTHQGASITVSMTARDWLQQWKKEETINLVLKSFREGELLPLLSMWLGDGKARWNRIGRFEVAISAKEPWRIGKVAGDYEAVVAKGRDVFTRLIESAGPYGKLLDALQSHKWNYIKESAARKRSVEIFREAVGNLSADTADTVQILESLKFSLVNGNGGTLIAAYYTSDIEEAVAVANALEKLGMRPNINTSNQKYVVYVGLNDIKRNEQLKKVATQFLAEKLRSGTPRQREIARRIIERNPDFSVWP